MQNNTVNKPRLQLLDTVRGITLISMIIFHTVWDLVYIYNIRWQWFRGEYGYIWQQSICWTFILLSGYCFNLSKNHLRRGIIVSLGGIAVSVVTYTFTPSSRILFGVLTLIGASMLIMIPLDKVFKKTNPIVGAVLSFLLFFILRNVNDGYLGFEGFNIIALPQSLYKNLLTAFLGFPSHRFYSSDYFSLLPWLFLFMTGYFLYKITEKYGVTQKLFAKGNIHPFGFIGRHSLLIYLLHQPVVYGVLYLLFGI